MQQGRRAIGAPPAFQRGKTTMHNDTQSQSTPFVSDVQMLRQRAREHIEQGAVTSTYGLDAQQVCNVLNDALATEIVCVLRYRRHYYICLLYTSDAADERSSVDLGGRRIIKKKKKMRDNDN